MSDHSCAPWCEREDEHWQCQRGRHGADGCTWVSLCQVPSGLYDDGVMVIAPQPEPQIMVGREAEATSYSLGSAERELAKLLRILGHGDLADLITELAATGRGAR